MPKALFWMALLYVFFTTVVAFWIGRPLIRLSFRNELTNAAFRYALVRLRDAAEAVGFYRGEGAERGQLMTQVRGRHRQLPGVRAPRASLFLGWNRSMNQIVDPLPTIVQAPRLFAGQIRLRRRHAVGERVRPVARLAVVLPRRLRLVRQLPGRHHPAATAWSTPTKRQGSYRL